MLGNGNRVVTPISLSVVRSRAQRGEPPARIGVAVAGAAQRGGVYSGRSCGIAPFLQGSCWLHALVVVMVMLRHSAARH